MNHLLKILSKKSKFQIKAEGKSMLPILRSGDIVFIKKVRFDRIKVNDIILVSKNRKSFIHRVIYLPPVSRRPSSSRTSQTGEESFKIAKYIITKGDNNFQSDGKIFPRNVYGVAYQIKRGNQIIGIDDIYLIQSSIYFKEIVKIKKAFEIEGIDYVFLKGLPIHLYYEGKHPRRIYADCDILVRIEYIDLIRNIFQKYFYKESRSEYSPIHKILKDKETSISFHKIINHFPVVFDIHFEPVFMMNQIGKLEALYPEKLIKKNDRFIHTK